MISEKLNQQILKITGVSLLTVTSPTIKKITLAKFWNNLEKCENSYPVYDLSR